MANKVNVEVQVTSNIDEQTRSAKVLRKELEGAQKFAGGGSGMGKAASETKTFATAAEAAASSSERLGYGIARAAAGTGAAGRDFAKQAQGLGGLVHVYATFAANLFAVGAAFTLLKNAADTANMVKGLDQLGAASGRGLGTLSKEIVALTDGAVTLREAMEATAKATAAGMSSEDLKRLAVGAKNASQALGVDMSDALSRLSRGITKLEPELLDELGIFVRVDKAASDYARTLGKPASALTDFERRAGFAAATLDQVEKKFGAIKIDSNPYNQLSASLSTVMQTGLEAINFFLEPVLRLLAASPTGLAVAIAAVGTALLKQAIPALGSIKESMKEASQQTLNMANIKAVEAAQAKRAILKEKELAIESKLEDQIGNVLAAEDKLKNMRSSNINKSTAAYKLLKMAEEDVMKIEEAHYQAVEKAAKRAEKAGDIDRATSYREIAIAVRANVAAENELADAKEKNIKELQSQAKWYSQLGMIQTATSNANKKAIADQIAGNAAYNASTSGVVVAFKKMFKEISEARKGSTLELNMPQYDVTGAAILDEQGKHVKKLEQIQVGGISRIRASWTGLKGAIGIATTAVGTAMNAFGMWAQVAGLAIAGISLLIDKFSATTKEAKATSEALDALTASVENMDRVLARLEDIDPLEKLSVENIQAKATALGELSASISTSIKKAFAQLSGMNALDKMVNFTKSIFGADITDNLAESLAVGITTGLKAAGDSTAAKQAKQTLAGILGDVDLKDAKILESTLEGMLDKGSLTKESALEVARAMDVLAKSEGLAAAKGTELKASMQTTDKAAQDFINSFIPQDNITKLGSTIMAESSKLALALEEPTQRLNAIRGLLESPVQLGLLGDTGTQMAGIKEEVDNATIAMGAFEIQIKHAEKEIDRLTTYRKKWGDKLIDVEANKKEIAEYQKYIDIYRAGQEETANKVAETLQGKGIDVDKFSKDLFTKGAQYFSQGIADGMAKAGGLVAKAYTGLAPSSMTAAIVTTKVDNAQIAAERDLIKSNMGLIEAIYDNTQTTQYATLAAEKRAEEAKTTKDDKKIAELVKSMELIDKSTKYIAERRKASGDSNVGTTEGSTITKTLEAANKAGVDVTTLNKIMQTMSSEAAIYGKNMQIAANNVMLMIKQRSAVFQKEIDSLNTTKEQNTLELNRLNIIRGVDGVLAPQLLAKKQTLEYTNAEIDANIRLKQAEQEHANIKLLIEKTGMKNNDQSQEDLDKADQKVKKAKEFKDISLATVRDRQALDTVTNEIAATKVLVDIEQQRLDALSSIGVMISADSVLEQGAQQAQQLKLDYLARQQTLQDQITAAKEGERAELQAQLTYEERIYEKRKASLDLTTRIRAEQANMAPVIQSINAVFDQLNGAAGSFAEALFKSQSTATAYSELLEDNTKQQQKAFKIIQSEKSSTEEKRDAFDELVSLKSKESKLTKEGSAAQLRADAVMIGSAKKMFNEKSMGYKVLGGIEKAMHIASIAMQAKETAVAIAGMVERIPVWIAGIFGEASSSIPPPFGQIIAGGLIATLVALAASAGGGGGGSVSMPAPPSYEDLQKVQGTGQDYTIDPNTGMTTTSLALNNGGVLGDIAAKSEDIANSIDYMESYTFETLIYNNKMLEALKGIEVNTGDFITSLAATGLVGGLGTLNWGTQSSSSSSGGSILGWGGSSSQTVDVTDWGIKITGALDKLLSGIGDMLMYKTIKTTYSSTSKGWFGSSSSSSTSYRPEYAQLDRAASEAMLAILANAKDAVISAADILGYNTKDAIETTLNKQVVNIDLSLMGKTAEEAMQDALAEIGVQTNIFVAKAYPFLEQFRQWGEGLTTTMARITTNMQTVNVMFQQMGKDFAKSFLLDINNIGTQNKVLLEKEKQYSDKVAEVQAVMDEVGINVLTGLYESFDPQKYLEMNPDVAQAGIDAWQHYLNYGQFEDRIYGGTRKIYDAYINAIDEQSGFVAKYIGTVDNSMKLTSPTNTLQELVIAENIKIYEDLIDKFGGDLETFVDKTQFYIDNFVDENTVLLAHYDAVETEMNRLGYASVDTKAEFIALVDSLDLTSESGRQLYVDLMNVAPGFDVIAKHIQDLVSSAGMATSDFAKILMDGITGSSTILEIGEKVATTIKDGILEAVASSYVTSISTAFNDLIITPIVTAVTTGATLTNAISATAITEIRNIAVNAATAISTIFKDAGFVSAIQEATIIISETIKGMAAVTQITTGSISKIIAKYNTKLIDAYKKQASEIQSTLNKFKGFSDSLKEFRDSLLTGALSPKTPLEKYNLALQDLDETYAKAMSGDETAIARLKTVAQTFLDMSREYYASSDAYVSDFDRVQRILDSTIGLVDTQVSDLERQLQVAQDQLAVLGYIDETTKTIAELLAEANAGQKEEVGNVLSTGFTSLDKNFDGLLTMEELKTSGLASEAELRNIYTSIDTNGDGQISMLEALKASTEGTTFSVNSLAPILEGIRNGTLSVKDAVDYLAQLNIANVGAGGAPITLTPSDPAAEEIRLAWVQQYVQGAYRDILNREAEAGGLQYWTNQIVEGKLAITDLYSTISQSDEAINSALQARVTDLDGYITRAYTMLLDRAPDVEGFNFWKQAIESNSMSIQDLYSSFTTSDEYLRRVAGVVNDFNSIMSSLGSTSYTLPGFAEGGYHNGGLRIVGENGPELEATGEARIWTAAQTQQMLSGANSRNSSNADLIAEIQRLNQKIDSLERTVQQGDIMNMQATERNTQQVSNAVVNTGSTTAYANKLQQRATIV